MDFKNLSTPPKWKKPGDVMKLLRRKKSAPPDPKTTQEVPLKVKTPEKSKRKNPFRSDDQKHSEPKKLKESKPEDSNDESLFKFLGLNDHQTFTNDWSIDIRPSNENCQDVAVERLSELPIDWALRSRLRVTSETKFPWSEPIKSHEEASGITSFVRCLEPDSNPNSRLHHCCLYWQHPNLPWLELFPRTRLKRPEAGKTPLLTSHPDIKQSLLNDWTESLRSLTQLIRSKKCPYFYLVSNTINCLFRAPGVNGLSEANVMISSTTVGFRKLLHNDGIEFSLPLEVKVEKGSDSEDEVDKPTEWIETLGLPQEDLNRMKRIEEFEERNLGDASLVMIKGSEINGFVNFLINYRHIIPTTGILQGVPPTLLSPVGFSGGTLMPLKVRHNNVMIDNESYHSVELSGPIFPHTIHYLCGMLRGENDRTITTVTLETTNVFTQAAIKDTHPENLDDSEMSNYSLDLAILPRFASNHIKPYENVKFSKFGYFCS